MNRLYRLNNLNHNLNTFFLPRHRKNFTDKTLYKSPKIKNNHLNNLYTEMNLYQNKKNNKMNKKYTTSRLNVKNNPPDMKLDIPRSIKKSSLYKLYN